MLNSSDTTDEDRTHAGGLIDSAIRDIGTATRDLAYAKRHLDKLALEQLLVATTKLEEAKAMLKKPPYGKAKP